MDNEATFCRGKLELKALYVPSGGHFCGDIVGDFFGDFFCGSLGVKVLIPKRRHTSGRIRGRV